MSHETLLLAAAIAAFLINITNTRAPANCTFVSGLGTDSSSCGVASPCRNFAYTATQTATGGEVTVLASAGYGLVTITRSMTITNPGGVEASIRTTSGENAITINTTDAANGTNDVAQFYEGNMIGSVTNNGTGETDGTNHIDAADAAPFHGVS